MIYSSLVLLLVFIIFCVLILILIVCLLVLEFTLVVSILVVFLYWGDQDLENYCDKMAHLSFSPNCEIE